MERNQALDLLKEISKVCKDLDGTSVSLVAPEVQGSASTGYMIHIKNPVGSQDLACLKEVLEKNNLAMRNETNTILIYKPTI